MLRVLFGVFQCSGRGQLLFSGCRLRFLLFAVAARRLPRQSVTMGLGSGGVVEGVGGGVFMLMEV